MYPDRLLMVDFEDLGFLHEKLRAVMTWTYDHFGPQVITSMLRIGDNGIHGELPLRAIDVRCRVESVGEAIAHWINEAWIYDPERPNFQVCIFHDVGRGYHLHIQVHPNTRMR